MILATVNLTLLSPTGYATADEPSCKSSQEDSWLCKGDPAWMDGYLVVGKVLKELLDKEELLKTALVERNSFENLSTKMQNQRNEFRAQRDALRDLLDSSTALRDEYRHQRDDMGEELEIVEAKYLDQQEQIANWQAQAEAGWAPWEVGLLSGGVAILAGLAGAGLYALASM